MSKNEIVRFYKYEGINKILVVTYWNKLMSLHCPFPVRFKYNLKSYKKNQIVLVKKILVETNDKYVFQIDKEWYYTHHFDILCYNL